MANQRSDKISGTKKLLLLCTTNNTRDMVLVGRRARPDGSRKKPANARSADVRKLERMQKRVDGAECGIRIAQKREAY